MAPSDLRSLDAVILDIRESSKAALNNGDDVTYNSLECAVWHLRAARAAIENCI